MVLAIHLKFATVVIMIRDRILATAYYNYNNNSLMKRSQIRLLNVL